jgi:hypothetical protein
VRDAFIHPAGQDDNLGDSALRAGLMIALESPDIRRHIHLYGQSSDYEAGIARGTGDRFYRSRAEWLRALGQAERPLLVVNAGEVNPRPGAVYPSRARALEMRDVLRRGGLLVAAGLGVKDVRTAAGAIDPILRRASLVSWRDHGSRAAAGFGGVAPDWAFRLGTPSADWSPHASRNLVVVTLRHDRPSPPEGWADAVRSFAAQRDVRIVTLAQVARDAPLAVRLARELGGEYLVAPSMRHDLLDSFVREVYSRARAVISDRAHALIMGATEGAYPIGSAADPQKIHRLLDVAGLASLTGPHVDLADRATGVDAAHAGLAAAIERARADLVAVDARIRGVWDQDSAATTW